MKSLISRVRRAYAPPQLSGRPMLENIVQPLYSTAGLDDTNLPAEVNLFQYAKGQNVPGAGDYASVPSTLWHTNMETPSSLASPKVFTITGIRVHLSHLASSAQNTPQLASNGDLATSPTNPANWQDVLAVFNSGVLRLQVGPKVYANHPLWFFPSNIGTGGPADISTAANALASDFQRSVSSHHQVGQGWAFDAYPVVIAAQQSFGVNVSFTWATNPQLIGNRALTVFLDGILSREVS